MRFAPSSTTAMFMGWPISMSFFSAASMMPRASASFSIGTPVAQSVGDNANVYASASAQNCDTCSRRGGGTMGGAEANQGTCVTSDGYHESAPQRLKRVREEITV